MHWKPGHKLRNRDYEIETVLGEGGFGITYKAKDLTLNIPVVIKTPNNKLQRDPNYAKYKEKFFQEARQLAQLGLNPHPHIVRVSSLFIEDNLPCIVMDFIPGESLYNLVQVQGPLSETKAREYIQQIGSALMVCHRKGIIHRDVHPNNILIRQDNGQAILIDFGIAVTTDTSRNTHSGSKVFAPWEQVAFWETESSQTPQVDIYTLAASLYYLVTGKTPTPSLARKYNNQELQPPEELNSSLSDSISQAIFRGMEVEPENRPDSIEKWLKLLLPPATPQPKPPYISQTKTEVRASANARVTTQKNTISIIDRKEEEYQKQQAEQQRKQEEYQNKLERYKQEFLETVELEYPLSKNTRNQINILQQSLGLKTEDIKRIEQPILAAKYQEKLKEEERQRQKEQKAERVKQLELQKQRERQEYENKLQRYEQEFTKSIQAGYPLDEYVRDGLKNYQRTLELTDEDIARIEQPILAQEETKYQQKLKEEEAKRQRKQEAERVRQLELQKQQEREEYENKLQQYKQEFSRMIQREYPLDDRVRYGLKRFQQSLGLRDEDVEQIEQPLIDLKESEYQQRLKAERLKHEEKERLRQQQQAEQQQKQQEYETSQPKKKLTLKIIAGLAVLIGGVGVSANYLIWSSQTKDQPAPKNSKNSEVLKELPPKPPTTGSKDDGLVDPSEKKSSEFNGVFCRGSGATEKEKFGLEFDPQSSTEQQKEAIQKKKEAEDLRKRTEDLMEELKKERERERSLEEKKVRDLLYRPQPRSLWLRDAPRRKSKDP